MHYPQNSKPTGSYGLGSPYRRSQYQSHGPLYTQTPPPSTDNLGYSQTGMNNLTQAYGGTNLSNITSMGAGKQSNNAFVANGINGGSMLAMHSNGQVYYHQLPDGTMMMSGMNTIPGPYQQYAGSYNVGLGHNPYLYQPALNGFASSTVPGLAGTARPTTWETSHHIPVEVPDLAAPRRTSLSSNEGSPSPHTPFNFGNLPSATFPNIASLSPWQEPSPIQLAQLFPFEQIWRTKDGGYEYVDYYTITRAEPRIPVAIPARLTKDSGRGTFDKILDNEHGTTNVYIRGLHPNTTDETLHRYGARFGDIVSCKAIIDLRNGDCKGFGFLMYHNYTDAENCIRCFYYLGYEAKFAKLSHNQRLKDCADPENNNLYVSYLPKIMTENELKALFTKVFPEFKVTSTKVLKDEQGISRGVGFVRFETHEICEQVLDHFDKHPMRIGDDDTVLQLRYADSQAQKKLKEESAAHRGFKANEYNMEAFGPGSPFYRPSMTPLYSSPLDSNGTRSNGSWRRQPSISPGTFMNPQSVANSGSVAVPMMKSHLQNVLPAYSTSAGISAESPCATAAVKRDTNSIGGNTLVGSNASVDGSTLIRSSATNPGYNDTIAKPEDSSDADEETADGTVKVEPPTTDDAVDTKDKIGPSPSKASKAKL